MRTLVIPTGSRRLLPTLAVLAAALAAPGTVAAAVITVNSTAWNQTPDSDVTLSEAEQWAGQSVPVCVTTGERNRITGVTWSVAGPPWCEVPPNSIGDGAADEIRFASPLTFVWTGAQSAVDLDDGDSIWGPVTFDGLGATAGVAGVRLDGVSNNSVNGLTIFDFPGEGILCRGCKNLIVKGNLIAGCSIGFNAYGVSPRNPDGLSIGLAGNPGSDGNTILDNDFEGIKVTVDPAFDNPADFAISILNNGVGDDGTIVDHGNGGDGIRLENVRGAQVGDGALDQRNFVSFNDGSGIVLTGTQADDNVVENNYVGLDASGVLARGNAFSGIFLGNGASTNLVFGNRIAGNGGPGVDVWQEASDGNLVQANRIGTTDDGASARPNAGGVRIVGGADNTLVGSSVAADRNLISGNSGHGVGIYNSGTTGTIVRNNWIGVNAAGTAGLPNTGDGVRIQEQATGALVELNTISGNGNDGVGIRMAGTSGHAIQLNDIGVRPGTSIALGNAASGVAVLSGAGSNVVVSNKIAASGGWGIYVSDSGTTNILVDANTVGLAGAGNVAGGVTLRAGATNNNVEDNVIGFNGGPGVELDGVGTQSNDVYRNRIGTNAAGTVAAPNFRGVRIWNSASNNVVGGATASLGNVISGNTGYGVGIWNVGTSANQVLSNLIGTNALGTAALANGTDGIQLGVGSASTLIRDNVISGNAASGIKVLDAETSATIQRNHIGAGTSQGTAVPNASHGVYVNGGEGPVFLGAVAAGNENVIAYNVGAGVRADGSGNTGYLSSLIYGNGGLAIDLGATAGVTPNDLLDADSGANGLLNMPIITSARVAGTTSLTAQIKYHGTPSTTFRAYLFSNPGSCDESGHGEAESAPYTSATFITDASGNGAATITGVSFVGDILSALVRLESLPYATSELSTCRTTVASTSPLVFDDSFESGFVDAWSSWSL